MFRKIKLTSIFAAAISLVTALSFITAPLSAGAAPVMKLSKVVTGGVEDTAENNVPVELVKRKLKRLNSSANFDKRSNWGNSKRNKRYSKRHNKRYKKRYYKRGRNDYNIGAAVLGIIIGGAIVNGIQQRSGGISNSHIQYCYNRFRSYRHYDNSFQPYYGPRRQCRSTYWP